MHQTTTRSARSLHRDHARAGDLGQWPANDCAYDAVRAARADALRRAYVARRQPRGILARLIRFLGGRDCLRSRG